MIETVTERWATDCSVFHGDACLAEHGDPPNATAVQLWLTAKREFPGRLAGPRLARCRELMRDHGMLP